VGDLPRSADEPRADAAAFAPGGFDFLGYHFEQGQRWPRKKSLDKLKTKIRQLTKRHNGHSLSRRGSERRDEVAGFSKDAAVPPGRRSRRSKRDMAIRGALGASRSHQVRPVLVESALLAAAGTLGGLVLANLGTPVLLAMSGFAPAPDGDLQVGVDVRVIAFAVLKEE